MIRLILCVFFASLFFGDVALAEPICVDLGKNAFQSVDKLFALLALVMATLKPVSWLLGKVADKTETKWDNKAAKWCGKALSYLGWLMGIFSIGDVPASVKHKPKFSSLDKLKKKK